jgi:hypothetical protein
MVLANRNAGTAAAIMRIAGTRGLENARRNSSVPEHPYAAWISAIPEEKSPGPIVKHALATIWLFYQRGAEK